MKLMIPIVDVSWQAGPPRLRDSMQRKHSRAFPKMVRGVPGGSGRGDTEVLSGTF
jgi:ribosome biogenesis protein Tsr3